MMMTLPEKTSNESWCYHLGGRHTGMFLFRDKEEEEEEEEEGICKTDEKCFFVCVGKNKNKNPTNRHRHLLNDLASMIPHGRKDAKIDTKSKLFYLNEVAELYNCNNILFFEARKNQDLYMWMSKAPNGPCIKLYVQNCTYGFFFFFVNRGGNKGEKKRNMRKSSSHTNLCTL